MELQIGDGAAPVSRVALVGMLDMVAVGQVETKFMAVTVARGKNTIVDLSQMAFIASLGMGMLVSAHKGLKRRGAKIVLLNPQPDVELALTTARLQEILPIAHSEQEAEQLLAAA
ncbi:MAG TPA: STAS domain-containing protein [Pirellulales bacterium]|jgi:anti-anti-sigma factor|nr:STAS domain-containing protein [Pirellulales bacterium]